MPHSLKAKLGGLRHKQIISDKDYDRLCKALETERERQKYFAYLDGVADGLNELRNDVNSVLDKIKSEIEWHRDNRLSYEGNAEVIELTNYYLNIIDKVIEDIKQEILTCPSQELSSGLLSRQTVIDIIDKHTKGEHGK